MIPADSTPVIPRPVNTRRLILLVVGALLLIATAFSPRLWLLREPMPGTFEWTRALGYLQQCESPFRRDVEPALQWRLLPPLAAHALGLRGLAALAIPWTGILVLLTYVAVLFRRQRDDWRWIAGGLLLLGSTSAVLVPLTWLGINDAWIWLGLLAVAFGRSRLALPLACLLCPWIDERFIIGFPLAWLCAHLHRGTHWKWTGLADGLWLLPYAATRIVASILFPAESTVAGNFLHAQLQATVPLIPLAPLGWWMGFRAGWIPIICAAGRVPAGQRLLFALVFTATAAVTVVLAADLSRSIAILAPVMVLGCFGHARSHPLPSPRHLLTLGAINLLVPALHVVSNKLNRIDSLPVEIIRLFRIPS